jgi:hypothetical protein
MASGMARATGVDRRWSARVRGGSAADVATFRSSDDGAAAGGEVREVLQFGWGKEEFLNRGLEKKGKGRDLLPTVAVAMASPHDSCAEDPLMDHNGEPTVSKGEVTCDATLDERRSTGVARGRGGRSGGFNIEAQRRKGAALLIPVREKRGKGGGAVRHGVRSSERRGAADNARRRWGRVAVG